MGQSLSGFAFVWWKTFRLWPQNCKATGSQGHGTHVNDPSTGRCFCYTIYGSKKPWGCYWYTRWLENVQQAVDNKQRLKAVFFPGQVGIGKLSMEMLVQDDVDLWNNIGLGGSQKSELATVDMMRWTYDQVDVGLFLRDKFTKGYQVDAWFEAAQGWRRGTVMNQEVEKRPHPDNKADDYVVRWTVRCDKTGDKFSTYHVCDTSMTVQDMLLHFGQDLKLLCSQLAVCCVVLVCIVTSVALLSAKYRRTDQSRTKNNVVHFDALRPRMTPKACQRKPARNFDATGRMFMRI